MDMIAKKVVVKKGCAHEGKNNYFWIIKAWNGETLAHSEIYYSRAGAIKTAKKLAKQLDCEVVYATTTI